MKILSICLTLTLATGSLVTSEPAAAAPTKTILTRITHMCSKWLSKPAPRLQPGTPPYQEQLYRNYLVNVQIQGPDAFARSLVYQYLMHESAYAWTWDLAKGRARLQIQEDPTETGPRIYFAANLVTYLTEGLQMLAEGRLSDGTRKSFYDSRRRLEPGVARPHYVLTTTVQPLAALEKLGGPPGALIVPDGIVTFLPAIPADPKMVSLAHAATLHVTNSPVGVRAPHLFQSPEELLDHSERLGLLKLRLQDCTLELRWTPEQLQRFQLELGQILDRNRP